MAQKSWAHIWNMGSWWHTTDTGMEHKDKRDIPVQKLFIRKDPITEQDMKQPAKGFPTGFFLLHCIVECCSHKDMMC